MHCRVVCLGHGSGSIVHGWYRAADVDRKDRSRHHIYKWCKSQATPIDHRPALPIPAKRHHRRQSRYRTSSLDPLHSALVARQPRDAWTISLPDCTGILEFRSQWDLCLAPPSRTQLLRPRVRIAAATTASPLRVPAPAILRRGRESSSASRVYLLREIPKAIRSVKAHREVHLHTLDDRSTRVAKT